MHWRYVAERQKSPDGVKCFKDDESIVCVVGATQIKNPSVGQVLHETPSVQKPPDSFVKCSSIPMGKGKVDVYAQNVSTCSRHVEDMMSICQASGGEMCERASVLHDVCREDGDCVTCGTTNDMKIVCTD